ncbi:STAS domain-containing protein [Streptomyces sp. NPDC048518]|uniref:STAS domain-containing protein n=1 Tax=Streptomyces sp. NPDC048518 TaxID=3155029 RepID=UPI0033D1825F
MSDSVSSPDPYVEQYPRDGSWVVVARGDLDMHTVPPLRRAMETAAVALPVLVLDVAEVTFADSSALNLLLVIHQSTTLRIAAPQPQLLRLLETTGADEILNIYPSTDHACAATAS